MSIYIKAHYNLIIKVREVISVIDYGPLWETMKRRHVTQYQLLQKGIDHCRQLKRGCRNAQKEQIKFVQKAN